MPARAAPPVFRGYVFGLQVESTMALPVARPSGDRLPTVTLREVSSAELAERWRPAEATPIAHWRTAKGRLVMSIDSDPRLGYRIAAPSQGKYLVSRDGQEVWSSLPAVPDWRWQRFLFSQVLPLVAALRGLSPFHASAVALEERALGFVASSGAGKTSVAAYLTSRGASFVTDDVMAVESTSDGLRAHPGPGVARVFARELRGIGRLDGRRLGEVIGRSDKVQVAVPPIDAPVALGALYFLVRSSRFHRFEIERQRHPDPIRVLASSFISYVDRPEFQLAHLDLCSRIVQSVPVYDVSIPEAEGALDVARAIERHAQQ